MAATTDRPSLPRPRARPDPTTADAAPARPRARPVRLAETPAAVADAATDRGALDADGPALLGTLVTPSGPAALVRLPTGEVRRVEPGDAMGPLRVEAIEDGTLRLAGQAARVTLRLPA